MALTPPNPLISYSYWTEHWTIIQKNIEHKNLFCFTPISTLFHLEVHVFTIVDHATSNTRNTPNFIYGYDLSRVAASVRGGVLCESVNVAGDWPDNIQYYIIDHRVIPVAYVRTSWAKNKSIWYQVRWCT